MNQHSILLLIALFVGGGIVAVIAYYLARFMRGSITLSLANTVFNPGDTITGSFDLHTKKELQGNKLIVTLIGTRITKTYHDGKSRTHSTEVYRDEVLIEGAKTYNAGTQARYTFKVSAPNMGMNAPELLNNQVGQILTTAARLLSDRSARLTWKLEARLDAKGVDLATSKAISINNKQLM